MPEAVLRFNLPDDQDAFTAAVQGDRLRDALDVLYYSFKDKARQSSEKPTWGEVYRYFIDVLADCQVEL